MEQLTATLTAVADPTRRAILQRLADGPATVTELTKPFRISQQAVSKHLAHLESAQLIEKHRRGRHHVCTLRAKPLQQVADWVEGYRRCWEQNFERLDALLAELQAGRSPSAASPSTAKTRPKPSARTPKRKP